VVRKEHKKPLPTDTESLHYRLVEAISTVGVKRASSLERSILLCYFLLSSLKQAEHDLKRLLVTRELTRSFVSNYIHVYCALSRHRASTDRAFLYELHFAPATSRRTLSTLLALQERFSGSSSLCWCWQSGFLSGPKRSPPVLPTSPQRAFSLLATLFSWTHGRSGCGAIAARAGERESRSTVSCWSHDMPCANFYEMNGTYSCTTALTDRNSRLISAPGFQKAGITLHQRTPSQLMSQSPLVRSTSLALEP
jgi:hypothetical protein